jgi:fumarate hydratase subunit alpha
MPTSRESLAAHFEELVCRAARHLAPDVVRAIEHQIEEEADETAKGILETILRRAMGENGKGRDLASDVGVPTFFVRVGCAFPGLSDLEPALMDGVRAATKHEPLVPHTSGTMTGAEHPDNCGAGIPVVHYQLVPGSGDCHVTVLLKGAASEALSALWMMPATTTFDEIGDRLVSLIAEAGGRPCPPLVIGVGLGGTPERAALLSRHALLRPLGTPSEEGPLHDLETEWCEMIDRTGIGPMGLGGGRTALAVHVNSVDRHQAFLPVAVSVACWSDRKATVSIDRNGDVHW